VQSNACLSYAECQQLSTKSTAATLQNDHNVKKTKNDARLKNLTGIIREPQRTLHIFVASKKTRHYATTKSSFIRNEIIIHSQRSHHSSASNLSFIRNEFLISIRKEVD